MNIEELAFKDRITLAQLNELVLLDIIEFLQLDRKQWINQFTQTHNESVEIQKENEQLTERMEYLERSNNRREDIIIEQRQEISDLEDNWNELKEYLHNVDVVVDYSENYDGHFINYDVLIDKMQELQQENKKINGSIQTYDILLKANTEENKRLKDNWDELKEYCKETKLKEFEKSYGKRYGKTFTQAEIIVCNMILDKMQELEKGSDSNVKD